MLQIELLAPEAELKVAQILTEAIAKSVHIREYISNVVKAGKKRFIYNATTKVSLKDEEKWPRWYVIEC